MSKRRLTNGEMRQMACAVKELAEGGASEEEAIHTAELLLPESKRRALPPRLYHRFIRNAWSSNFRAGVNGIRPAPAPAPEPPKTEEPTVAAMFMRLESLLLEHLKLFREMNDLLRGGPPPPAKPESPPATPVPVPAPPKPRPKRIAVIGLMLDQFRHVAERTCQLPVELVFVDKESRSFNIGGEVDAIICSRHIKHPWEVAAIAKVGRDNYIWAGGGVTSVTQAVFDINSRLNGRRP